MHTLEEIKQAGENAIGNASSDILNSSNHIKVPVAIPHRDNGILNKYNVFFKKEINEKLGEVWSFTRYIKNG